MPCMATSASKFAAQIAAERITSNPSMRFTHWYCGNSFLRPHSFARIYQESMDRENQHRNWCATCYVALILRSKITFISSASVPVGPASNYRVPPEKIHCSFCDFGSRTSSEVICSVLDAENSSNSLPHCSRLRTLTGYPSNLTGACTLTCALAVGLLSVLLHMLFGSQPIHQSTHSALPGT